MCNIRFTNMKELLMLPDDVEVQRLYREIHDYGYIGDEKDNSGMAEEELKDIIILFRNLNIKDEGYEGYILGYKSQPITEQFDMLKYVNNEVLNIELKDSCPKSGKEGIREQLIKHKRYLEIGKNIKASLFTYVMDENTIYELDSSCNLMKSSLTELSNIINNKFIGDYTFKKIDNSDYMISPYNEIEKFYKHNYFLTEDQVKKEKRILRSDFKTITFIQGKPGTGKSLLLFDIAKKYSAEGKSVRLILGSKLNSGVSYSNLGFKIQGVTNEANILGQNYDENVIIIDEAQRLYDLSFQAIKELSKQHKLIFSIDERQALHPSEKDRTSELKDKISSHDKIQRIELKKEIRYSKELSSFIQRLILGEENKRIKLPLFEYKDVDLIYANNDNELQGIMGVLQGKGYQPIELTSYITKTNYRPTKTSHYSNSLNVHRVLGREYDKVACVLDNWVEYDKKKGIYGNCHDWYPYLIKNSVLEALSRVRKKITIIVVENPNLYVQIAELLTKKKVKEYQNKKNGIDNKLNELTKKLNKDKMNELHCFVENISSWAQQNNLDLEAVAQKVKKELKDKYNETRIF